MNESTIRIVSYIPSWIQPSQPKSNCSLRGIYDERIQQGGADRGQSKLREAFSEKVLWVNLLPRSCKRQHLLLRALRCHIEFLDGTTKYVNGRINICPYVQSKHRQEIKLPVGQRNNSESVKNFAIVLALTLSSSAIFNIYDLSRSLSSSNIPKTKEATIRRSTSAVSSRETQIRFPTALARSRSIKFSYKRGT